MVVLVRGENPHLFQQEIDVLFLAGQQRPAPTAAEALAPCVKSLGRVDLRIDRDGNQLNAVADPVTEPLLQLREIGTHRGADRLCNS